MKVRADSLCPGWKGEEETFYGRVVLQIQGRARTCTIDIALQATGLGKKSLQPRCSGSPFFSQGESHRASTEVLLSGLMEDL